MSIVPESSREAPILQFSSYSVHAGCGKNSVSLIFIRMKPKSPSGRAAEEPFPKLPKAHEVNLASAGLIWAGIWLNQITERIPKV